MQRLRAIIALVLCVTMVTSCYKTRKIKPTELKRLDGYRYRSVGFLDKVKGKSESKRTMRDFKNRTVEFDEETELILRVWRRPPVERTYRAVDVKKNIFMGVPNSGGKVRVPLKDIQHVEVEEFDGSNTVVLIIGIAVLTLTLGVVIGAAVGASGGGDSDD